MNRIRDWFRNAWLKFKAWFVAILVVLGLVASPLLAAPKDFSWTNPTERMDGSVYDVATEQAEVRIYCDGSLAFTSPGAANTFTGDLNFGSHTCYATSVDIFGQESDASNSVTFVVTPARPNPPILSN